MFILEMSTKNVRNQKKNQLENKYFFVNIKIKYLLIRPNVIIKKFDQTCFLEKSTNIFS